MIKTLFEYLVLWPCHQPDKLMKVDVTISILVKERRNDIGNVFYWPDGHFKPLPTWSITLTMSFSSSSEGDHPKLVITWLRQLIKIQNAPKRLFWGGSSSWHGRQLQERHCMRYKRKKYEIQRFCVKHKGRLCMNYKIYYRRLENTKYKYFAWNTKPVQAPQLLLILLHPWKYGSLRFSAVRSIL